MKRIILFTDGSCLGNPGAGGWACLLRWGSVEKEISGAEPNTNNNQMELQAVIAGLAALKEQCAVKVVTDSQWRNSRGVPVANRDLWERLVHESRRHHMNWTWVRGHGASAEQNRCDQLAQTAARRLRTAA